MAHVFGIQRMTLKPGIDAEEFEQFMKADVFPTLSQVFQDDKTITHGFTAANWLDSKQFLLRGSQEGEYLRMVVASCEGSKAATDEGRVLLHKETNAKTSEIFETVPRSAPGKLNTLATRTAIDTYVEMVQFPHRKGPFPDDSADTNP